MRFVETHTIYVYIYSLNYLLSHVQLLNGDVFERPSEWHLIYLDGNDDIFKYKSNVTNAAKFNLNAEELCRNLEMSATDTYCRKDFTVSFFFCDDSM